MKRIRWFFMRTDSTDANYPRYPQFQGAEMRRCDLCESSIAPKDLMDHPTSFDPTPYLCEPCGYILASGKLRGMVKVEADGSRWNRGNPEGGQRLSDPT